MNNTIWSPQPRQAVFMSRPEKEALYGGAAGGGKSDALVMEATRQIEIPHYKGLIIRKTFPQLAELIDKSLSYYPQAFPKAKYNSSEHTWRFPSGSKIVFGSLQHNKDKLKYQGQAYDFIGFDELTHFTHDEYMYLFSRNRANGPGTRCYIRATANPGGVGHGWVKERFITAGEPMKTLWEKVNINLPDGSIEKKYRSRIFVPSTVFDNQILLDNDPEYLINLAAMPEAERKALLYGDWDSYSGQYFPEFKNNPEGYINRKWTNVIEPFNIPDDWQIYRSFDWGYRRPFSCGWWAVDYDGCLYRVCEFYGCNGTPNEGLKWFPQQVFKEIHDFESQHELLKGKKVLGIADPACWDAETGESIADTAAKYHVYFDKGDHSRISGWMQMHYRFAFDEKGFPMLYVFKNCKDFIRTIPLLQYDEIHIEDLDTDGEDHIADESRYMCMARPIKPRKPVIKDNFESNPLSMYLDINRRDLASERPLMEMIIK